MKRVLALGVALTALTAPSAAIAADPCPNAEFRTGASAYLPDCRAYEMVSPVDKGTGEVGAAGAEAGFRASADGNAVLFPANGAFAGATSFFSVNTYWAGRGANGWSVAWSGMPHRVPSSFAGGPYVVPFPEGFSVDGRHTVVRSDIDPETGAVIPPTLFLRDLDTGGARAMTPQPLQGANDGFGFNLYVRGNQTFDTVYFSAPEQLTPDSLDPGVPANRGKLYRYANGQIEHASYLPDGTPQPGVLPDIQNDLPDLLRNTVTPDGSVYYFYPGTSTGTPNRVRLYRGEAGVKASAWVNESENTLESVPSGESEFQGASADGKRVFFESQQRLVDEDTDSATDLYLYEHSDDPASDQNLTLVSVNSNPANLSGANVTKALGASDDGSTVYFMAANQILDGEPEAPQRKLYRWHEGEITYIAPSNSADANNDSGVTPDGRYLMFVTAATGVTADDNGGLKQQYLYDSQTGEIHCTSCVPGGVNSAPVALRRFINASPITREQRRWLSDDGRVFFETTDALVSRDTNGIGDVYTWKDGIVDLISSGRSVAESQFADASADGSTVLFMTSEQLVDEDIDNRRDLYAARVGGGLPGAGSAVEAPCQSSDCQGAPSQAPGAPPVASIELDGAGNVDGRAPTRARLTVARVRAARGAATRLQVRISARGRIVVRGAAVRRVRRARAKAGRHSLRVVLRPRARRALARRGRLATRVRVVYRPRSGAPTTRTVRLVFRSAKGARR